jgi:hypothetical protein
VRPSPAFAFCLLSTAALASLSPLAAQAESQEGAVSAAHHPRVKLDRLVLPANLLGAKEFETHLLRTLRHEARHADWGTGGGSKISYRFFVERLDLREEGGVLHVACTALGRLPKGKSAKSQIDFGGDPRERKKVVERVLDMVARGVVTRLAELERARRTL